MLESCPTFAVPLEIASSEGCRCTIIRIHGRNWLNYGNRNQNEANELAIQALFKWKCKRTSARRGVTGSHREGLMAGRRRTGRGGGLAQNMLMAGQDSVWPSEIPIHNMAEKDDCWGIQDWPEVVATLCASAAALQTVLLILCSPPLSFITRLLELTSRVQRKRRKTAS